MAAPAWSGPTARARRRSSVCCWASDGPHRAGSRSAVWSLGVVLLGEGLVASALVSVAQLSPRWLAFAVFNGLTDVPSDLVRDGLARGWGAAVQLAVITLVCLTLSGWRLGHLRLSGSS